MTNDTQNNAHDVTNDDVTNDDNVIVGTIVDDETNVVTTTTRPTTRAIRNLRDNAKNVNVPDTFTRATIVTTSSGARRISHENCDHARSGVDGKRARAKCRANVERAIANTKRFRNA